MPTIALAFLAGVLLGIAAILDNWNGFLLALALGVVSAVAAALATGQIDLTALRGNQRRG